MPRNKKHDPIFIKRSSIPKYTAIDKIIDEGWQPRGSERVIDYLFRGIDAAARFIEVIGPDSFSALYASLKTCSEDSKWRVRL